MDVHSIIYQAVEEQRSVFARYDGHDRYFCPHRLGWKQGKPQAMVWQYGGSTSKGPIGAGSWKCLELAKLRDVKLIDDPWSKGPIKGTGELTCIDRIEIEVPY